MSLAIKHNRAMCFALTALALYFAATASAQDYPAKPVRYIVPFPAAASPDIIARLLTERLSRLWNQQVVVDNRSGAGGTLGAAFAAKSPADGYTLFQCNSASSAIAEALYARLPYDHQRDFAPISRIGTTPMVLVVHPSIPARSVNEFIAYAKANPGKVSYGSVGIGSSTHMAGATLAQMSGTDMVHVPYRGSSMINTDILGGQIQTGFVNVAGVIGLIKEGKLRPLAVSTARRTSALPDVPAVAENFPGFEVNSWYGLMAPAKTPPAIVAKLQAEIVEILKMPDIQARLKDNGLDAEGTTPEAYGQKIKDDLVRWSAAVKAANIKE